MSAAEEMEDQRNVARAVAADAIREIERIIETGDTYGTREIVANLKEALTPGSFLHNSFVERTRLFNPCYTNWLLNATLHAPTGARSAEGR